jgi:glyoxylase-like metal-dependent hydrolase (beta-lactamase superfamily II)
MAKTPAAIVLLLMAALLTLPARAQDARAVVKDASDEMGVTGLDAVTYSGVAAIGNFGQSRTISFGLASSSVRNYARTIDFTIPASRATGDLIPPATAAPVEPREYDEMVTPEFSGWAHQMQLWVTPWGFLRGAAAANPTVRTRTIDGVAYRVVSWSPAQKAPSGAAYRVNGYINADNLVDRVETWVEHPIFGDMHVEYLYTGYRPLHSVMVPTRVAERRVGMETFVAEIRQFESNPPDLEELMALPPVEERRRLAAPPPLFPAAASERIADGVYRVTGAYESLIVEFKDHLVVLEAPQGEQRGLAILAEAKRLFPSKRVRYVVNTHAHFDHAEGLPPFVAEGVTIITDDTSRYFIERALSEPRTLLADALAKARKQPRVDGVLDSRVLTDGTRTIELHHVQKLAHSDGMLVAWLPKERILFTTDFDPAGTIEQLGLKVERHVQVH